MEMTRNSSTAATRIPPMTNHRGLVPPTNIMMAPKARIIKVAERWLSKKISAANRPMMAT